jgi:hypothetical protein
MPSQVIDDRSEPQKVGQASRPWRNVSEAESFFSATEQRVRRRPI